MAGKHALSNECEVNSARFRRIEKWLLRHGWKAIDYPFQRDNTDGWMYEYTVYKCVAAGDDVYTMRDAVSITPRLDWGGVGKSCGYSVILGFMNGFDLKRLFLDMPAGREMDALVAEKVMGWKNVHVLSGGNVPYGEPNDDYNKDFPCSPHTDRVPEYSTDIAAAWTVLNKIECVERTVRLLREKWICYFSCRLGISAEADTAPLAICRAALILWCKSK